MYADAEAAVRASSDAAAAPDQILDADLLRLGPALLDLFARLPLDPHRVGARRGEQLLIRDGVVSRHLLDPGAAVFQSAPMRDDVRLVVGDDPEVAVHLLTRAEAPILAHVLASLNPVQFHDVSPFKSTRRHYHDCSQLSIHFIGEGASQNRD